MLQHQYDLIYQLALELGYTLSEDNSIPGLEQYFLTSNACNRFQFPNLESVYNRLSQELGSRELGKANTTVYSAKSLEGKVDEIHTILTTLVSRVDTLAHKIDGVLKDEKD